MKKYIYRAKAIRGRSEFILESTYSTSKKTCQKHADSLLKQFKTATQNKIAPPKVVVEKVVLR